MKHRELGKKTLENESSAMLKNQRKEHAIEKENEALRLRNKIRKL